jgi:hypothetical protein
VKSTGHRYTGIISYKVGFTEEPGNIFDEIIGQPVPLKVIYKKTCPAVFL